LTEGNRWKIEESASRMVLKMRSSCAHMGKQPLGGAKRDEKCVGIEERGKENGGRGPS